MSRRARRPNRRMLGFTAASAIAVVGTMLALSPVLAGSAFGQGVSLPTPTASATATATASASVSATATPSASASATATPTSTPTAVSREKVS